MKSKTKRIKSWFIIKRRSIKKSQASLEEIFQDLEQYFLDQDILSESTQNNKRLAE